MAQKMTEAWNQSVVVDNRGGAGGIIGTDMVAKATPDGHTVLLATAANAANVVFESKLPYDLLKDFAPVVHLINVPFVLVVNPKVPAQNARELITLAKSKAGALNYGTVGIGTSNHLMMELFNSMGGAKIVHVPYKGVGPALVDLMGGRVNMMLFSIGAAAPYLKDNRVRPIAVTTSTRAAALPDVPAIAETLQGYDMTPYYGILVPARTPKHVIDILNRESLRILQLPDIRESYAQQGFATVGSTPQAFGKHLSDSITKFARIVREANIKPE
jgi:tripartite-type tricarboxylate transporter receptor subunit TctC